MKYSLFNFILRYLLIMVKYPPRTHAISDQTFTGNQFPSVHDFDIILRTLYLFFFIFGAGNSSYIALNKPVINALSSTSSTKSISFAP